jgi:alkylphenol/PAH-inducible cytochrome P450 monooxygenase
MHRVSKKLIEEKTGALLTGNQSSRDVLSVLGGSFLTSCRPFADCAIVQANVSEDPNRKLSEVEMESQMTALTLAGHETTANTVTWLLWELAKHPEYQDKLRAAIIDKRSEVNARGDQDFSIDDLESVEYLQAAIMVHWSRFIEFIVLLTFMIRRKPFVITVSYTICFALHPKTT